MCFLVIKQMIKLQNFSTCWTFNATASSATYTEIWFEIVQECFIACRTVYCKEILWVCRYSNFLKKKDLKHS